jgi:hypothetical protein
MMTFQQPNSQLTFRLHSCILSFSIVKIFKSIKYLCLRQIKNGCIVDTVWFVEFSNNFSEQIVSKGVFIISMYTKRVILINVDALYKVYKKENPLLQYLPSASLLAVVKSNNYCKILTKIIFICIISNNY